jgi:general secretion pathway protein A
MYKEFFGLQALPFNLTPDPAFLFLPPKHREAITGLTYAIVERKGLVVLTGDAGTGKTTLLNSVLKQLPETQVYTSVILNPTLTPVEFLENVLLDFGIPEVPTSKAQRLWRMQDILARAHQENKIVVLIIDEAHKLSFEVLEEIRLLGNYEFGPDKFLQILLLGQCELDGMMNRHELRQFKQRIALRLYIDPLTPSEVEPYIEFRWTKAGGMVTHPFTPEAIEAIVRWSSGNPRLINSLCDTALLMAYGEGIRAVGASFVRAAATNLALVESPAARSVLAQVVAAVPPVEQRATPPLPVSDPIQVDSIPEFADGVPDVPFMAHYGQPRVNSSLLRRLAGKFGLQR